MKFPHLGRLLAAALCSALLVLQGCDPVAVDDDNNGNTSDNKPDEETPDEEDPKPDDEETPDEEDPKPDDEETDEPVASVDCSPCEDNNQYCVAQGSDAICLDKCTTTEALGQRDSCDAGFICWYAGSFVKDVKDNNLGACIPAMPGCKDDTGKFLCKTSEACMPVGGGNGHCFPVCDPVDAGAIGDCTPADEYRSCDEDADCAADGKTGAFCDTDNGLCVEPGTVDCTEADAADKCTAEYSRCINDKCSAPYTASFKRRCTGAGLKNALCVGMNDCQACGDTQLCLQTEANKYGCVDSCAAGDIGKTCTDPDQLCRAINADKSRAACFDRPCGFKVAADTTSQGPASFTVAAPRAAYGPVAVTYASKESSYSSKVVVSQTEEFKYDASGNLLEQLIVAGDAELTYRMTYDAQGRLTKRVIREDESQWWEYTYYANGLLKTVEFYHRVTVANQPATEHISSQYLYDANGVVTARIDSTDQGIPENGMLTVGKASFDYFDGRLDVVREYSWLGESGTPACGFKTAADRSHFYKYTSGRLSNYSQKVGAATAKSVNIDYTYDADGFVDQYKAWQVVTDANGNNATQYQGLDFAVTKSSGTPTSIKAEQMQFNTSTEAWTVNANSYFTVALGAKDKSDRPTSSVYWDGAWRPEGGPTGSGMPQLVRLFALSPNR